MFNLYMTNVPSQAPSPCPPLHLVLALTLSAPRLSKRGYNWTITVLWANKVLGLLEVSSHWGVFLATVTACSLQRDLLVCDTYTHSLVFNPSYT